MQLSTKNGLQQSLVCVPNTCAHSYNAMYLVQESLEDLCSLHRERARDSNGLLQNDLEEIVLSALIRHIMASNVKR